MCWFFFTFFRPQGSITDDKSKATHHIYPSPSQQDEGRGLSLTFLVQYLQKCNICDLVLLIVGNKLCFVYETLAW